MEKKIKTLWQKRMERMRAMREKLRRKLMKFAEERNKNKKYD